MWNIITLNNNDIKKIDTDVTLSTKLDEMWLWLDNSVEEMKSLMDDAKNNWWAEALKVRLELIKHTQALHWSKASKSNTNIWVFIHPWQWNKLNY